MEYEDLKAALDELHAALEKASLPDVKVVTHPQHLAVIAGHGDFCVWVQPWGHSGVMFKVEGSGESHRCGTIKQTVEALRRLTAPTIPDQPQFCGCGEIAAPHSPLAHTRTFPRQDNTP